MQINGKYNINGMLVTAMVVELIFWSLFVLVNYVIAANVPGLKWDKPQLGWLFLTGPFILLVFWVITWSKNHRLKKYSDPALLHHLAPELSSFNATVKYVLWRLAAAFAVMALINPQLGSKTTEAKVRGIDVMVALDVSNSMLADDLAPNRLSRATRALEKMLENMHGDRIGLVVFAGQAFIQLPITNDYSAGKLFLSGINTSIVPVQGTSIGAAIDLAANSFDEQSDVQKAIVVITDGENHEDDAIAAAKNAAQQGIKVYTIGMGSPSGTPIPEFRGKVRDGFKKDGDGNVVVSKLNEGMLKEIAHAGKGSYFRASNAEVGLNPLLEELNTLDKSEMGSVNYSEYESRFQLFLGITILLLVAEFLIRRRKGKLAQRLNLFT